MLKMMDWCQDLASAVAWFLLGLFLLIGLVAIPAFLIVLHKVPLDWLAEWAAPTALMALGLILARATRRASRARMK